MLILIALTHSVATPRAATKRGKQYSLSNRFYLDLGFQKFVHLPVGVLVARRDLCKRAGVARVEAPRFGRDMEAVHAQDERLPVGAGGLRGARKVEALHEQSRHQLSFQVSQRLPQAQPRHWLNTAVSYMLGSLHDSAVRLLTNHRSGRNASGSLYSSGLRPRPYGE